MARSRDISKVFSSDTALATDAEVTANFIAKADGYAPREVVYFTSSGSFTKATYPWLRAIRIKVVGGGGSGGGAGTTGSTQCGASSGGAAGGYAERFFTDISSLDATVTVTVGTGGAATSTYTGNTGGTSAFGTSGNAWRTRATGGSAGSGNLGPSTSRPGGAGGVGTNGDLLGKGGAGGPFISFVATAFNSYSGFGGSSVLSGGGEGRTATINAGVDGIAGSTPGGGGSGGINIGTNGVNRSGGAGGNGTVIVELYG